MICVEFTAFCDLWVNLRIRLATLHKSVRKFWFCKLALTCESVWPELHNISIGQNLCILISSRSQDFRTNFSHCIGKLRNIQEQTAWQSHGPFLQLSLTIVQFRIPRVSGETTGYTWSGRKIEHQNEVNPVLSKLYILELLYLQDV